MGLVFITPQGLAEACGLRWTIKNLLLKKKHPAVHPADPPYDPPSIHP